MRRRLKNSEATEGGDYFKPNQIYFIKSGCVLFDCMLGGGWPLGRMSNLVGDKSTGKTLCAIEACANFARQYDGGLIYYRESEAAFDESYAAALGLPVDRINFGSDGLDTAWETVEDIFEDLEVAYEECMDTKQPGLYIIDSLDALSSRAELSRKIDEGSYGMEKQKQLGQLFRRQTRKLRDAHIALLIVSQVREKIGITFGNKYRRSGGKALDFYASLVVYLSHLKRLQKTVGGIKRPTAIRVKAHCEKNKIAMPFRECEFTLRFGYGIDEMAACVEFLEAAKATKDIEGYDKNFLTRVEKLDDAGYKKQLAVLRKSVRKTWRTIESDFAPTRRKYT